MTTPRPPARGHFDLDRVRRNWERAATPETPELPARFAEVRAPHDPWPESRALLARIRALAEAQFPGEMEALDPFFGKAAGLIDRLEACAGPAAADDAVALRAELQKALDDLEGLMTVFARIGF